MSSIIKLVWGVCLAVSLCACVGAGPDDDVTTDVGVAAESLEFGCLLVAADRTAELGPSHPNGREINTIDPLKTSLGQSYGSLACSGFVSEFTNPNGYNVNEVFVAGAGWVKDTSDANVYGNPTLCANLTLEADMYGYRNGVWDTLGSTVMQGDFRPKDDGEGITDRCHLSYVIVQPGNYETVRVVAKVSNATTTYPFRVHAH
jgi:hypothetical protein